jgi:2-oxo-3-hexenedioate decarboxylase
MDVEAITAEVMASLDDGRQIAPFSTRDPAFSDDHARRVAGLMRQARVARGEIPLGRKIGFTNRTIWAEYGVFAPNWGTMYDRTVRDLADIGGRFPLSHLAEPRIEPEIVFRLARAPTQDLDDAGLLAAIEWTALGFEIVQSPFPGWKFSPADTLAANALHGALLIGPRRPAAAMTSRALATFEIDLKRDGVVMDHGRAANVLDGPLDALRHLTNLLAADKDSPPLAAGEIVTTGTLTRALPVKRGETWSTTLSGLALDDISVRFD